MSEANELEARIDADPDAREHYRVYGDWLEEQGDPRGELCALEAELAGDPWGPRGAELRARRRELFEVHADELLGPLAELESTGDAIFSWEHGFIRSARLTRGLDLLLAHRSARFLRELTIGSLLPGPSIEALCEARPLALRRLSLGGVGEEPYPFSPLGDLSPLSVFRRLRHLVLIGCALVPERFELPELERLELRVIDLEPDHLRAFSLARWPLSSLAVWGNERLPSQAVLHWLEGARSLLSLTITNDPHGDQTIAALAESPALARLEELDLSFGGLTGGGAATLATHSAFRALKRIDVSENLIDHAGRALLAPLSEVRLGLQHEGPCLIPDGVGAFLRSRVGEGRSSWRANEREAAIAPFTSALKLADLVGDTFFQSAALEALGGLHQELGRFDEAVDYRTRRVEVARLRRAPIHHAQLDLAVAHTKRGEMMKADELLEEALASAEREHDERACVDIETQLAFAALMQSRPQQALERAQSALARTKDDAPGQTHNVHAAALQALGRFPEAEAAYAKSLDSETDPWSRGASLLNLSGQRWLQGRYDEAEQLVEQALQIARETKHLRGEARALLTRGQWGLNRGKVREACADLLLALPLVEAMRDRANEANVRVHLGFAYLNLAEPKRAREHAERALALFRDTNNRQWQAYALDVLGGAAIDEGDVEGSIELYSQALVIGREVSDSNAIQSMLLSMGTSNMYLGRYELAMEQLEEARGVAERIGDKRWRGWCLGGIAAVHYARGDLARAESLFAEMIDAAATIKDLQMEGRARARLAGVLARAGRLDEAKVEVARAIELTEGAGDRLGAMEARASGDFIKERSGAGTAPVPEHAAAALHLQWLRSSP